MVNKKMRYRRCIVPCSYSTGIVLLFPMSEHIIVCHDDQLADCLLAL